MANIGRTRPASDFCDRLRALMEERGMTQSGLARRLGVGRTCVNHWYWGISEPRIGTLLRIRRLLGCEWDELLGR
jgi:transcriptional regulator with XRE-family HTH domain